MVTGRVASRERVNSASCLKYGIDSGRLVVASLATDHMITEGLLRSRMINSAITLRCAARVRSLTYWKLIETAGASETIRNPCSSANWISSSEYG